jgi:copper homeostasis protein
VLVDLEFAVQDVAGARIAQRVGADRVELCAALQATGGITPSVGLIEAVCAVGIPVHVLIRPRPGGFVFHRDERGVMHRDIVAAMSSGAAGVVIGGLTSRLQIDLPMLKEQIQAADGGVVTFHRAFDVVPDQLSALETLVGAGVRRILTSGGASTCREGMTRLCRLTERAAGRIEIMAGGGVDLADVDQLLAAEVSGIHLSARRTIPSKGGGLGGGTAFHDQTDGAVAALMAQRLGRGV